MTERLISRRGIALTALLAISALLVGCEGAVTVDLSTEAPARREIQQVVVSIVGLEFRTSGGGTQRLEFRDSTSFDLLDSVDGNPLRMFTDEELPDDQYTGVRLLFDTDDEGAQVVTLNGGVFPIVYADGQYADVNFEVDENDSSNESLVLTIDLRQSLTFDDDENEYTLTPVLRSVRTEDAGQISGTVTISCPGSSSLVTGGAVYLFRGEDVTPDDVDRTGVEPFATTAVTNPVGGTGGYTLRFIPEGDYTVAATCRGNEEDPADNDELDFRGADSVQLDEAESLQLNLDN